MSKSGSELFIVDNSDSDWKVLRYLRETKEGFGVFVVTGFCGHKLLGSYERNYVFPLYDLSFEGLSFVDPKPIQDALKAKRGGDFPTPEDIFHFAYAVLHSPGYRSHYAEFLKIDFPRLPLTGNLELFGALARLGGELTALHLLESPKLAQPITEFIGTGNPVVEKVSWSGDTVWLDKAKTKGFRGVPENVWKFHIGGYQVCEKWLKDRGPKKGKPGRTLTDEDIAHYHKIVVALTETIRLMAEIDEVIETHGGWPGAFQTTAHEG